MSRVKRIKKDAVKFIFINQSENIMNKDIFSEEPDFFALIALSLQKEYREKGNKDLPIITYSPDKKSSKSLMGLTM